jgi:hypothetical protein
MQINKNEFVKPAKKILIRAINYFKEKYILKYQILYKTYLCNLKF